MPDVSNAIDGYVKAAAVQAFEVMCFVELTPAAENLPITGRRIVAQVDFDHEASGQLRLELPPEAAETIASNFFGGDEANLSESQVRSLVAELTNIICGSLLSRLNPGSLMMLSSPEIYVADEDCHVGSRYDFQLEGHPVLVSIAWDERKDRVA